LMNRYGTPQIVDIAKKPAHARALMGAEDIHAGTPAAAAAVRAAITAQVWR
jgi:hypothetical protein